MSLKISLTPTIDVWDWDELVEKTYGKPYNFQQQDGCQDRGSVSFYVPCEYAEDEDSENAESLPEKVNGEEMGVRFESWLARDPNEPLKDEENGTTKWMINMFWERNFYPCLEIVAEDLYKKGLIPEGRYDIKIDW